MKDKQSELRRRRTKLIKKKVKLTLFQIRQNEKYHFSIEKPIAQLNKKAAPYGKFLLRTSFDNIRGRDHKSS